MATLVTIDSIPVETETPLCHVFPNIKKENIRENVRRLFDYYKDVHTIVVSFDGQYYGVARDGEFTKLTSAHAAVQIFAAATTAGEHEQLPEPESTSELVQLAFDL